MVSLLPYLWMLTGSFFFAAMSILTASLSRDFSFIWIVFIRSLIAMLVALAMAKLSGIRLVYFSPPTLWLRSLAGCSSMLFLFFAMTHYDVAIILSLSSTYPLWVAILGWPMLGDLPSRDTWLALIVSALGMWLVYSSAANPLSYQSNLLNLSMPEWAIPSGILAGLLSAVALIGLHKVKQVDARAIVTHFSAVSTIISGLIWLIIPGCHEPISNYPNAWLRLSAVGITAVLGQLCLTRAFASGIPARVSVVGLSQVAFAAMYQWTATGNLPTTRSFFGMLLVVGATLWVMLRNQVSE